MTETASTIKGRDIQVGQRIQSANRWYKVISTKCDHYPDGQHSTWINVCDNRGQMHPLLIFRDEDYPVRDYIRTALQESPGFIQDAAVIVS